MALPGTDPPSSILGGEEFLSRIYAAYRGMHGTTGSTVWNTALLIGWDEPGGTYRPRPAACGAEPGHGVLARRARLRVRPLRLPGTRVIVSPWIAEGEVFNDEYRHTSLIATLRGNGPGRCVHATRRRPADLLQRFTLDSPRDPKAWPDPDRTTRSGDQQDKAGLGTVISAVGKNLITGIRGTQRKTISRSTDARRSQGRHPDDQVVNVLRGFLANWFPLLASKGSKS